MSKDWLNIYFLLDQNNFSEQKHYIGKTLRKHFYQL